MKSKTNWYLISVIIILIIVIWGTLYFLFYNVNNKSMTCEAVQTYIENSNKTWEWDYVISKWDTIVVDYIGTLEDGTVFDTSIESVAKDCGQYTEWRDYTQWLEFEVWAGNMIAWFDSWVEWMKLNQTKTINIAAADAYWESDPQMIVPIPKAQARDADQYEVWSTMLTPFGYEWLVTQVTDEAIYVDMNHPLAGKDLTFTITVREIK